MNRITVLMSLIMALIMSMFTAGCGGETTALVQTKADYALTDNTLRLFSVYSSDGAEAQQISCVNGAYNLYTKTGSQDVIAVFGSKDASNEISLTWPSGFKTTTPGNRLDAKFTDLGRYTYQVYKNGIKVGEEVLLDLVPAGQKPIIEAYVKTNRGSLIDGKSGTLVTCTMINTDTVNREVGLTIERMAGPIVDFTIGVAGARAFSGNQGIIDAGQEFFTGRVTMWRSSTNKTVSISDEINRSQYFETLAPGETMVFKTWFVKP
jgi:hypothetical protein